LLLLVYFFSRCYHAFFGVLTFAFEFLLSLLAGTGGGGGGAFYVQIFSSFFDGEHTAFAAALSCAPMLATAAAILFANQFFRASAPAVAKDVFCITFVCLIS
jgi:hypothetical protein